MRRLVGYDLNGRRDFAARNWLKEPGQEPVEGSTQIVSGGVGGVVVWLEGSETPVGGALALRAPHGRGSGWGEIGDAGRREKVADLLEAPERHRAGIVAALRGTADGAGAVAVMAIPDIPRYGEVEQEVIIDALRRLRSSRRLPVWRPVLACLCSLDRLVNRESEGRTIGVVTHQGSGLASQKLRIRVSGGLPTPERRRPGQLHPWAGGIDHLVERAEQALVLAGAPPALANASLRLVPLAMGENCEPELQRHANGTWEVVRPPAPSADLPPLPAELGDRLASCDSVLLETPLAGPLRDYLAGMIGAAAGQAPVVLPHESVALGALEAARRLDARLPVYLDFLPQISTIVQDSKCFRNYDLIPADAVLPAGERYRSESPARLGLAAGTETLKIYLRKEATDQCRLAEVDLPAVPSRNAEIALTSSSLRPRGAPC